MKRYALIGRDVSASLSPQIHRNFFQEFHLEGEYDLLSLTEEEAMKYFKNLRKKGYAGWNITHPYKRKILPFLDECSEEAKKIGAVNTVAFVDGMCIGYNTDVDGFYHSLSEEFKNMKIKKILLLGAGGAARAILTALTRLESATVYIYNRTEDHAVEMCRNVWEDSSIEHSIFLQDPNSIKDDTLDMIVNATTEPFYFNERNNLFFFHKNLQKKLKENGVAYDIKYESEVDQFKKRADESHLFYRDGQMMLVFQALFAQLRWENLSLQDLRRHLTPETVKKYCFSTS